MNKVIHFGAWEHINPILHFPEVKEFVFVTTGPRSATDTRPYCRINYMHNFIEDIMNKCESYNFTLIDTIDLDPNYYKSVLSFYNRFIYSICSHFPSHLNPTLFIFFNIKTKQYIKYYVSTNILFNLNDHIIKDIEESDGLIIYGDFQSKKILDYFTLPKILIQYSNKNFDNIKEYNRQNLMHYLYELYVVNELYVTNGLDILNDLDRLNNCPTLSSFFNKIVWCNHITGKSYILKNVLFNHVII